MKAFHRRSGGRLDRVSAPSTDGHARRSHFELHSRPPRQRLPSGLVIEGVSAPASRCSSTYSRRDTSDNANDFSRINVASPTISDRVGWTMPTSVAPVPPVPVVPRCRDTNCVGPRQDHWRPATPIHSGRWRRVQTQSIARRSTPTRPRSRRPHAQSRREWRPMPRLHPRRTRSARLAPRPRFAGRLRSDGSDVPIRRGMVPTRAQELSSFGANTSGRRGRAGWCGRRSKTAPIRKPSSFRNSAPVLST